MLVQALTYWATSSPELVVNLEASQWSLTNMGEGGVVISDNRERGQQSP
jgi:hypothetical protein